MKTFAAGEIESWCTGRELALGAGGQLAWDQLWESVQLWQYGKDARSAGDHADVAARCVDALGRWDECLVWFVVSDAASTGLSGWLFRREEKAALIEFVRSALESRQDAHVFPVRAGRKTGTRAFLSRDAWLEIYSRSGPPVA